MNNDLLVNFFNNLSYSITIIYYYVDELEINNQLFVKYRQGTNLLK